MRYKSGSTHGVRCTKYGLRGTDEAALITRQLEEEDKGSTDCVAHNRLVSIMLREAMLC